MHVKRSTRWTLGRLVNAARCSLRVYSFESHRSVSCEETIRGSERSSSSKKKTRRTAGGDSGGRKNTGTTTCSPQQLLHPAQKVKSKCPARTTATEQPAKTNYLESGSASSSEKSPRSDDDKRAILRFRLVPSLSWISPYCPSDLRSQRANKEKQSARNGRPFFFLVLFSSFIHFLV